MMIAPLPLRKSSLTYEEYLREGEVSCRYDITDGVRIVSPAPLPLHQAILENLIYRLGQYRRQGGQARAFPAPLDVLISKVPLRVRQPDVTVIALSTYRQRNVRAIRGPLEFAPELVVEIVSDSDRKVVLDGKVADYAAIGVRECWIVRPDGETVEILTLHGQQFVSVATHGHGQRIQSVAFPDLTVDVADIFAE